MRSPTLRETNRPIQFPLEDASKAHELMEGGEHIGKPLLLRGQVEMHTGLVFLSLLGGLEVFGLLGIIIGPLVISFFLALMRMYQRDFQRMVEVH